MIEHGKDTEDIVENEREAPMPKAIQYIKKALQDIGEWGKGGKRSGMEGEGIWKKWPWKWNGRGQQSDVCLLCG